MRYAIISDIHSNLDSLNKFLGYLPKLKIDKIICLGDIVGYNADPNEVVKIISKINNLDIIRGNHDRAVALNDYKNFSYNAAEAIRWTIKKLDYSNESYVKKLIKGPKIIDDAFAICHGSAIDEDEYLFTASDARRDFKWLKKNNLNLLFFGHTHQQVVFTMNINGYLGKINEKSFKLSEDILYIINPGSMGQPRDMDPRAAFAVYNSENNLINLYRYEYPIKKTQQKILNNGLPQVLAYRLSVGR